MKKITKDIEKKQKELVKKTQETYAKNHNGKKIVTRRDFLSTGLIPFAARFVVPSVSTYLWNLQRAQSNEKCLQQSNLNDGLSPFITLNLVGGAMLAGNYVPTDLQGQLLPTYNKMGLGNSSLPITREFNNAPFAGNGISKFIEGLRSACSQQTRDNTAFLAVPVRCQDDSGDNRFDISGMVTTAGLVGSNLPNLGTRDSDTGVRQRFSKIKPPNPLRVRRFTDIENSLEGTKKGALSGLSANQRVSFFELLNKLNLQQVRKVANQSGGKTIANLVDCSGQKNIEVTRNEPTPTDIRLDNGFSQIWGINGNTNNNNENFVFGSMVHAGISGSSGTVALEKGGYDYHDKTRSTGDGKDREAGVVIGKILESAAILNRKVFIYVTSDGACNAAVSNSRSAPWTSDRGSAGMAFAFAYDPTGRPETSGFQVGGFTAAQAANDDFISGTSPEMAGATVFANYLQFNKRLADIEKIIPGTFSTDDLNKIIKFA